MLAALCAPVYGVMGSAYQLWRSAYGQISSGVGCTDAVPDDEDWDLKLLGVGWRKPLDRRNWPFIGTIAVDVVVRICPEEIHLLARTQESRRFRLGSGCQ